MMGLLWMGIALLVGLLWEFPMNVLCIGCVYDKADWIHGSVHVQHVLNGFATRTCGVFCEAHREEKSKGFLAFCLCIWWIPAVQTPFSCHRVRMLWVSIPGKVGHLVSCCNFGVDRICSPSLVAVEHISQPERAKVLHHTFIITGAQMLGTGCGSGQTRCLGLG